MGRHLVPELCRRGHDVVAVTSKSSSEFLAGYCEDCVSCSHVVFISSADRESIARYLDGAQVLLSCAFPRKAGGEAMARGLEFIGWLFSTAAMWDVDAIINVSSQSVYDPYRREPASEDTPPCPQGSYAVAKYATEQMLDVACRGKAAYTSIRLASLIGPGFDERVVNKMVSKVLAGERLTVQSNNSRYGYLDIVDAVSGLVALAESDSMRWRPVYNLGPNESYTLMEMAQVVSRECASLEIPASREISVIEVGDSSPTNSSVCAHRFQDQFGWRCRCGIDESVRAIVRSKLTQS